MIKAVLFDFGGVLSEQGKRGSVDKIFAEIYGIDEAAVKLDVIHDQLRRGLITDDAFFAELNLRHPGKAQATRKLFMKSQKMFKKSEPVYALAERLRAHHIQTGVFSNIFAMSAAELRRRGFYDGFDPLLLSSDERLAKPDFAFYELAIKRLKVMPNEIIFIDDQEKCRPPAERLGMHFILATSPDQIVRDVTRLVYDQNSIEL
jgi:epoxide hydrolase-like predicted phosphatase